MMSVQQAYYLTLPCINRKTGFLIFLRNPVITSKLFYFFTKQRIILSSLSPGNRRLDDKISDKSCAICQMSMICCSYCSDHIVHLLSNFYFVIVVIILS